jgi:toluene monooxygenase system ferredoxin subunit
MVGLEVAGRKILLINFNDTFYAYEDKCAHQGVPLSEGSFKGDRLICGAHLWEYDVCTGRGINPRGVKLKAFPVKVENGNLLLDPESEQQMGMPDPLSPQKQTGPPCVGPVLESGNVADAVIAAIRQINENVEVEDRGAYLRVLVPHQCIVTQEAIERNLGQSFKIPGDLEKIMPSFMGILTASQTRAVWSFQKKEP